MKSPIFAAVAVALALGLALGGLLFYAVAPKSIASVEIVEGVTTAVSPDGTKLG